MNNKIFITSDLHFCHDKEFIWKARGFNSVEEMNEAIVKNWNDTVDEDSTIYLLGDIMLKDNDAGMAYLNRLKGHIVIVAGNHDTSARINLYKNAGYEVSWANMLNYKGYHFFMSHFPSFTGNLEKESLKKCTCNLYGHTHQKTHFYEDIPFMYHVGVDAHNCTPVLLDNIIEEMEEKVRECFDAL